MPRYPAVLDMIPRPLKTEVTQKLIKQLMIALNYLHLNDLVHMDVKPATIFVDNYGIFFLGDFGSTCKTGDIISSITTAFYPKEFAHGRTATILHYFWMLAMTVYDVCRESEFGKVGI
jgi:serine/threonine protein kinase